MNNSNSQCWMDVQTLLLYQINKKINDKKLVNQFVAQISLIFVNKNSHITYDENREMLC